MHVFYSIQYLYDFQTRQVKFLRRGMRYRQIALMPPPKNAWLQSFASALHETIGHI